MLTLDAILLNGTALPGGWAAPASIELVKIDTAGSECAVIDGGAQALFHKLRPRYLVVNVNAPASDTCVRAAAAKHRFDVHSLALPPAHVRTPRFTTARGKHVLLVDRRDNQASGNKHADGRGEGALAFASSLTGHVQ